MTIVGKTKQKRATLLYVLSFFGKKIDEKEGQTEQNKHKTQISTGLFNEPRMYHVILKLYSLSLSKTNC